MPGSRPCGHRARAGRRPGGTGRRRPRHRPAAPRRRAAPPRRRPLTASRARTAAPARAEPNLAAAPSATAGPAGQRRRSRGRVAGVSASIAATVNRPTSESLRVGLQREQRVRVGRPGEAQRQAQLPALRGPARSRLPSRISPAEREQVEGDRRAVRGGQVVPRAAPRHRLLEGQVGQVVDRPVGVAALHVLAEPGPVEVVAVGDPVGADHARVAHVDHVRVDHVQRHAEAHEQHQADRQPGQRHERDQPAAGARGAASRRQQAHQQVEQHGVDQRNRHADLAPVEEDVRDAEAQQHEQVEVQQPERPARDRRTAPGRARTAGSTCTAR